MNKSPSRILDECIDIYDVPQDKQVQYWLLMQIIHALLSRTVTLIILFNVLALPSNALEVSVLLSRLGRTGKVGAGTTPSLVNSCIR